MIVLLMTGAVLVAAPVLAARHWVRRHGFWVLLFRFLSGHALDGQHRTNATWAKASRGPRPVLHPTGHAVRWHHMPRLHRAGIRTGTLLAVLLAIGCGLIFARTLTIIVLAVAATAAIVDVSWRTYRRLGPGSTAATTSPRSRARLVHVVGHAPELV